ncbi:MAG: hypothetical protein ABSD71_08605 [Bacteroidales bacterium]|jgi:ABC-type transporter Mla subunit MlaD
MKEVIALIFLCLFSGYTVYLTINKRINTVITTVFLSFSLFASIVISNYDLIKTIKWKDFQLETFQHDVNVLKDNAINEIKKEVNDQKQSIVLLITNANDTRESINKQRKSIDSLLSIIKQTQKAIDSQKEFVQLLNNMAKNTENRIVELNKASSQIAKLLIKTTYLQIETKNEFGTERANIAIKQILTELNQIITVVIPDPVERDKWINSIIHAIPEHKP